MAVAQADKAVWNSAHDHLESRAVRPKSDSARVSLVHASPRSFMGHLKFYSFTTVKRPERGEL